MLHVLNAYAKLEHASGYAEWISVFRAQPYATSPLPNVIALTSSTSGSRQGRCFRRVVRYAPTCFNR